MVVLFSSTLALTSVNPLVMAFMRILKGSVSSSSSSVGLSSSAWTSSLAGFGEFFRDLLFLFLCCLVRVLTSFLLFDSNFSFLALTEFFDSLENSGLGEGVLCPGSD